MSYLIPPNQPIVVWVATEFDTDDGGRAWMEAATNIDVAKQHCQARHDRVRTSIVLRPEPLTWKSDESAQWSHGQTAETARVTATCWYEVRQIEVTA